MSTGEITPEEYVQAGDYLCHMFPTWKWNTVSDDVSNRDFLPRDKQFLVIRKVPCAERAQEVLTFQEGNGDEAREVRTGSGKETNDSDDDMEIIETQNNKGAGEESKVQASVSQDIDEMMQEMEIQDDEDIVDTPANQKLRYYDLFITYSTSYRVPKMYIVGFHRDGTPLTPQQMFEDITPDYRKKTATIERLPFYKTNVPSVSIHPCKHANVMRVLLHKVTTVKGRRRDDLKESGKETGFNDDEEENWEDVQKDIDDSLRADQYLIVFLKFITSVTPTIQHDYTMEGW